MARLSRAETPAAHPREVLAAAREEFLLYGFRDAKIDTIAEQAELHPGRGLLQLPRQTRALLRRPGRRTPASSAAPRRSPGPRPSTGSPAPGWPSVPISSDPWLGRDLLPEVMADEFTRKPFSQLVETERDPARPGAGTPRTGRGPPGADSGTGPHDPPRRGPVRRPRRPLRRDPDLRTPRHPRPRRLVAPASPGVRGEGGAGRRTGRVTCPKASW